MRLGFAKTKLHKRGYYAPVFPFVGVYAVLLLFGVAMLSVDASYVAEADAQKGVLDPAKIEFPERLEGQTIKDLGVALQRHENGRIKTYFQAGQAWQVGASALSFANDFSAGTYAAEGGIKITMIDETGKEEFWVNAERACVSLNDKIGKCFGFVKLEGQDIEIYGTNLLWNTTETTNVLTIEKKATLRFKKIDLD